MECRVDLRQRDAGRASRPALKPPTAGAEVPAHRAVAFLEQVRSV